MGTNGLTANNMSTVEKKERYTIVLTIGIFSVLEEPFVGRKVVLVDCSVQHKKDHLGSLVGIQAFGMEQEYGLFANVLT